MDRLKLAVRIEEIFMESLGLEIVLAEWIEFGWIDKREP